MENTPWRMIFIGAGASLLLLVTIYVLVLPKGPESPERIEKIISFRNTHVAGHDKGKKAWEFHAAYGWSDKHHQVTDLEDISKGVLYHEGEIVMKGLKAPSARAFRRTKALEARGSDKERITASIAFTSRDGSKERRFALVRADHLFYDPEAKRTTIRGRITLTEKEMRLSGETMKIDHDKETAEIHGDVRAAREDMTLSCGRLDYDSKDERYEASEGVKARIKGEHPTEIGSRSMTFFVDDKKEVLMKGGIDAVQGKKTAVAGSAVYFRPKERIKLVDRAKAVISKAREALKEDTVKKLRNPDSRKLLDERTVITSDILWLSTGDGDAKGEGSVVVTQKGREAKADLADYSDKKEIISLTGNVFMKRENEWISCRRVDVDVRNEAFEAFGVAEAEFKLKK